MEDNLHYASWFNDSARSTFNIFVEIRDKNFNLMYRSSYLASQLLENVTVEWVTIPIANYTVKDEFYFGFICIRDA